MKTKMAYQRFTESMKSGDGGAIDECVRNVFLRLAGDLNGLTALAISSAMRGEDPQTAAANCGCTIDALDRAIATFARHITVGQKKVAA